MKKVECRKEIYFKMNLQFFAKDDSAGEKTEDATSKKLTDARKEGQVAKSTELVTAVMLFALFMLLKLLVGNTGSKFIESFHKIYGTISDMSGEEFTVRMGMGYMNEAIKDTLIILLPIFIVAIVVAFISNRVQIKWQVTAKPLKPQFNKINPMKGFKRLLSKDKLMELFKAVMKIIVISYVVYDAMKDKQGMLIKLYDIPLNQAIVLIGNTVIDLGVKISSLFLIIGFVDLIYQKRKFKKDMKMTKQEVKDEWKQTEGDPVVKSKIRAKMREVSQRRMMQELPKADVVITNPTHLAVALKYDKEEAEAPILIAKGADYIASKIKDLARENKIEIVENKPLARMLYYNVEIGAEIPPELYQAVAEILAYVYGLKNR